MGSFGCRFFLAIDADCNRLNSHEIINEMGSLPSLGRESIIGWYLFHIGTKGLTEDNIRNLQRGDVWNGLRLISTFR